MPNDMSFHFKSFLGKTIPFSTERAGAIALYKNFK